MSKIEIPFTDDVLEKLGFTEYDDEHSTWGNRKLIIKGDSPDDWSVIRIIEIGDTFAEEHGRSTGGFVYENWFDSIRNNPKTLDSIDLNTVSDFLMAVKKFRPELFIKVLDIVNEKL